MKIEVPTNKILGSPPRMLSSTSVSLSGPFPPFLLHFFSHLSLSFKIQSPFLCSHKPRSKHRYLSPWLR